MFCVCRVLRAKVVGATSSESFLALWKLSSVFRSHVRWTDRSMSELRHMNFSREGDQPCVKFEIRRWWLSMCLDDMWHQSMLKMEQWEKEHEIPQGTWDSTRRLMCIIDSPRWLCFLPWIVSVSVSSDGWVAMFGTTRRGLGEVPTRHALSTAPNVTDHQGLLYQSLYHSAALQCLQRPAKSTENDKRSCVKTPWPVNHV